MKLKMLPNWCKKVGVSLFVITSIFIGIDDFVKGWNSFPSKHDDLIKINIENKVGETFFHFIEILALVSLLIYIMSKEKIEDDYINKLRLESYQLTILTTLLSAMFFFILSKEVKIELDFYISSFLLVSLMIFAIKKRIY